MGGLFSYFDFSGKLDIPDPTTGLTERERQLILSSWEPVRQNPTQYGVEILMLFFKHYPEYQKLFPFRDIPLKDLPENKRFQAHCNSVIYGFTALIDKLNAGDLLVTMLLKVGESHAPRAVDQQGFLHLKEILSEYFQKRLPKPMMDAWKKLLDVAFAQILQGVNSCR